jgi:protein TonB
MNTRLGTLITVSCLLHAGLLWYAPRQQAPALNIGGEAQALRITLAAAADSSTETPATLDIPPKTDRTDTARRAVAPVTPPAPATTPASVFSAVEFTAAVTAPQQPDRPQPLAATTTVPAPDNSALAGQRARPQTSSLSVSERVSAALQSQLAEAFDYPWLARKRGWQGLVTLSLHVAEDGVLSHWEVAATSGYNLLDRSALQAAQRIGRLQRAEQLLNGQSLNLSIPVRYRLLDG